MSDDVAPVMPHRQEDARFWAFYDDAVPQVYGYLVRRTGKSAAEDLTQEVFVTAARTFASGDRHKVTVPWLMTVAKSRLIDFHRAEGRRRRNLELAWSARGETTARSAEDASAASVLAPAVEAALDALSDAQRTALVLHHLDDLSVAEVAGRMGKSVRATESLLARARRTFRAAFEERSP